MALTLEQKIAQAEQKLARLKEKVRKNDTRQKIVVGAVAIHAALGDPNKARAMLALLEREVTREIDHAVIQPLGARLREVAARAPAIERVGASPSPSKTPPPSWSIRLPRSTATWT